MKKMSVKKFNERYPVGTQVTYFPIMKDDGSFMGNPLKSKTRSAAWELCGEPVVLIEGKAGGVALSHLVISSNESKT